MRTVATRGLRRVWALALIAVLAPTLGSTAVPDPAARAQAERPPNIVLILVDDMEARAIEAAPERFPNIAALAASGTRFANAFAPTPVGCPSRSTILRGQYAHNHGVVRNNGPDGGFAAFRDLERERSTVAVWLQEAGYRTAMVGKYLNGYGERGGTTYVPPGWDRWHATMSLDYFDYQLNENGRVVSYGDRARDYQTDVLSERARAFVRATPAERPFFLYLAPRNPHGPSTAAPRHANAFPDAHAPRVPSFNEADVTDKPAYVRESPRLTRRQIAALDEGYRQRLRSLLAVDDMVGALLATLRATPGRLENTHVFFTSDNGYHQGEHRRPVGKGSPYEASSRLPLLVRGPGVAAGRTEEGLVLNADLAPTFADLAGATPDGFVDGRSLRPLLAGDSVAWRRAVLLERLAADVARIAGAEEESGSALRIPPYRALRTDDRLYVEYDTGERELYDVRADPYELRNLLAGTVEPEHLTEADRLAVWLAALRDCGAGSTPCRTAEDVPPDGAALGLTAAPVLSASLP